MSTQPLPAHMCSAVVPGVCVNQSMPSAQFLAL